MATLTVEDYAVPAPRSEAIELDAVLFTNDRNGKWTPVEIVPDHGKLVHNILDAEHTANRVHYFDVRNGNVWVTPASEIEGLRMKDGGEFHPSTNAIVRRSSTVFIE